MSDLVSNQMEAVAGECLLSQAWLGERQQYRLLSETGCSRLQQDRCSLGPPVGQMRPRDLGSSGSVAELLGHLRLFWALYAQLSTATSNPGAVVKHQGAGQSIVGALEVGREHQERLSGGGNP